MATMQIQEDFMTELELEDAEPYMAKVFSECGQYLTKVHASSDYDLRLQIIAVNSMNPEYQIRILIPKAMR